MKTLIVLFISILAGLIIPKTANSTTPNLPSQSECKIHQSENISLPFWFGQFNVQRTMFPVKEKNTGIVGATSRIFDEGRGHFYPQKSVKIKRLGYNTLHFKKTAQAFLKSLHPTQLQKAQMKLEDSSRTTWHFLPGASWPRKGIRLDDLDESQEMLLFNHLAASLSEVGYDRVKHIMGLENVLAEIEKRPEYRDPELYTAAFYGNPGQDSIWAWSFEGHHISLNFTIADDSMTVAPRFFGANPATVPSGERKGERTLAQEEDLGFKMIRSMNPQQKGKAVLKNHTPKDIVSYNISKADPLSPAGLPMKEMDVDQKNTLISIIHLYLSMMPDDLANDRMEHLQNEEMDDIHFAYAGAEKPGKPHYYRVQGKTFLIEFDNTQNEANHIHTIWRDFDGDFGRDLIREHYKSSDHH